MAYESFDPRKAYREQLGTLWDTNHDGNTEYCITVTDAKGDPLYIPMYISEEVKSEDLPPMPFIELELPPGSTTYDTQDISASTRKMESFIVMHVYFTDTDNIDRTELAKKIKNRLHHLTRINQSITSVIAFMNIMDDGLEEETDGRRVVFHYILTLYCLYYDTCV